MSKNLEKVGNCCNYGLGSIGRISFAAGKGSKEAYKKIAGKGNK